MTADVALRRRGFPVGLALGLVSLSGVIADIVACSQILVLGGASSLLWFYPISGVCLAIPAILLTPVIDRWARLAMLRTVGLATTVVYAIALAVFVAALEWWPTTPVALVAVGVIWILAAVQNYLYPMLLWSLAADLFNVSQSRAINGWIASWAYMGRLVALGITVVSPALLAAAGVSLVWLLAIPPVLTLGISLWLPIKLRHAGAATGLAVPEEVRESLASGWRFVRDVPVWSWLLIGSAVTFTAGSAISLGISAASDLIIGADAGRLQAYLAGVQLVATLVCLAVQRYAAEPVLKAIGIKGTLMVLPISLIFSGLLLGASLVWSNLWILAAATLLWRVPAWSVDQNARSAALGFVPDQRRARVSLILVLTMYAFTWVVCAAVAAPGLLTGQSWLLGALPAVVAAVAMVWWVRVYRRWDASMLNWHLRRRKRVGFPELPGM